MALIHLEDTYQALKALYDEAQNETFWKRVWNFDLGKKRTELEENLWDCLLEIRNKISSPFSPELQLNQKESEELERKISMLEKRAEALSSALNQRREIPTEESQSISQSSPQVVLPLMGVETLGEIEVFEPMQTADPVLSKQQQMRRDLHAKVHPELAVFWENIFSKYDEEVVQDWILMEDGSFTIQLTRPLFLWTPNEEFQGGAVITFGDENCRIEGQFVGSELSMLPKAHKNQVQSVIDSYNASLKKWNEGLIAANPDREESVLRPYLKPSLPQPPNLSGMVYHHGLGSYVYAKIYLHVNVVHMLHMGYPGDIETPNIIVSAGNRLRWVGTLDSCSNIHDLWSQKAIALEYDTETYPYLNSHKVNKDNFYQYFLEHKVNES
jgi:hypothetical protein